MPKRPSSSTNALRAALISLVPLALLAACDVQTNFITPDGGSLHAVDDTKIDNQRDAAPAANSGAGVTAQITDAGRAPEDASIATSSDASTGDTQDASNSGVERDSATTIGAITIAWDGDTNSGGGGWSSPNDNPVDDKQSAVAHSGKALHWQVVPHDGAWSEWGWNWKAWSQPGTSLAGKKYFVFWIKLDGNTPPEKLTVTLRSSTTDKYAHQSPPLNGERGVPITDYTPDFNDKAWHQVVIPLADMFSGEDANEFASVYEVFMGAEGDDYDLYLDELGFAE